MTVPIIFVLVADPVGQSLVASLARPGSNLTGNTNAPSTVYQKDLQLLTQIVPGLTRVAVIVDLEPANVAVMTGRIDALSNAAAAIGLLLKTLPVRSSEEVGPALAEALAWPAQAIMGRGGPGAVTNATGRIVEFSRGHGLPTAFTGNEYVKAGGLLAYGANPMGAGRQAAAYVDKVLKGANPSDLPVQEPTSYDLAVNRTTAQALGILIPPELAQQVTEWIT
jgi:putative ABC transport system substrate-binding protein